ncbi:PAS domain-containing sensor histidine kinase [Cyclobacterium jeungdonense]|uniref:histidine kinase n=1 Tax=Cyclobacterium jeungdonense TaxID=708087 RepID=A0ABT8CD22_9BACT|nr:PAS domain-containing sensor histidine kinase [Cyclobacterium jeungdonense]MDN3690700.1 PAS domain-containing sensor histidine kinase [Cyclobacterium jeungdonense]
MDFRTKNEPTYEMTSFKMELFFELSLDLFSVAGFDGYFKRVNPALKKVLGYPDEILYGRPINSFIHKEDLDATVETRNYIISDGIPLLNFENRYLTYSGDIIWLSWTSVPAKEEGFIYAVAKNITHKKKLEEDRNSLITKLTQSNKKLKELTFTTSHDLRSPVNNLLSLFSIFNASTMEKSEILEFIELMQLSTEGLKNTLDGYVDDLSRRDVLAVTVEPLNLERVLKKVVNSIKSLIEASNTVVQFDFSACKEVSFNEAYLESICLNMLTNSIKYAKPGVSPVISIHSNMTIGQTQLVFEDNGIGFDMDKIGDKVFGFRETFHTNRDSKGIGLYLVHNHITALGGKIEIDSKPGQGARFTITFKE